MPAIKHAVWYCSLQLRNSSADANAKTGKALRFIRLCNAVRTDSSSSTITTTFGISSVTMLGKAGLHPLHAFMESFCSTKNASKEMDRRIVTYMKKTTASVSSQRAVSGSGLSTDHGRKANMAGKENLADQTSVDVLIAGTQK